MPLIEQLPFPENILRLTVQLPVLFRRHGANTVPHPPNNPKRQVKLGQRLLNLHLIGHFLHASSNRPVSHIRILQLMVLTIRLSQQFLVDYAALELDIGIRLLKFVLYLEMEYPFGQHFL